MFQFQILNGAKAGTRQIISRLPFSIGRSSQDDLRLEADGLWERHCQIEIRDDHRAALVAAPEAMTAVNGQSASAAILRNGDVIELGALRLQFGLSEATHRSLRFREAITWIAIAALSLAQVALIYILSVEL